MSNEPSEAVAILQRWTDSGAIWRVVSRHTGHVVVGLYDCAGGTEVDRLVSTDPALLAYLGDRVSSEDCAAAHPATAADSPRAITPDVRSRAVI